VSEHGRVIQDTPVIAPLQQVTGYAVRIPVRLGGEAHRDTPNLMEKCTDSLGRRTVMHVNPVESIGRT
jgi:hypothetical protein